MVASHQAHATTTAALRGFGLRLTGHSLAETYAVLTRLPGDARTDPAEAADVIRRRFAAPMLVDESTAADLPAVLSRHQIAGGAVYDALVALAARQHGATLATRDQRALPTYARVGVQVLVVG